MSTVQTGDTIAVYRSGTLYKAPADMSTLQDTDIIVVGRGNTPYKCTFLDWKVSQTKPPIITSVTLADSPEAGRFTSGTFRSTVVMTEDGTPASTKGIKAYVEGTLKSHPQTSGIASVAGSVLTLTDATDISRFATGDAVTEVTAAGTAGDATGTVGAVDATAKTITLSATAGTWDVGSQVKGPLKTVMSRLSTDEIVNVVTTPGDGATGPGYHANAAVPAAGGYVYSNNFGARLGSALYAYRAGGNLLKSTDNGDSWSDQTVTGSMAGKEFNHLFSYKGALYASPATGGIHRSTDGASWTQASVTSTTMEAFCTYGGELYATSTAGIVKTTDGINWTNAGTLPSVPAANVGSLIITDNTRVIYRAVSDWYYQKGTGAWVKGAQPSPPYMAAFDGIRFWVGGSKWLKYGSDIAALVDHPQPPTSTYAVGGSVSGDSFIIFNYDSGITIYNRVTGARTGANPLTGHADIIAGFFDEATNTQYLLNASQGIVRLKFSTTTLTFKTDKNLAKMEAPDLVDQSDTLANGSIASVNSTAKTMTLAYSTGTWGPANTGKTVLTGPLIPAADVKLYCTLDASLNVTDLQSPDPGYTAVTGAGPYAVKFPATMPSGNPPDTDLPAGTTITTEVQATNSSGTVTKASNTVTPA